MDNERIKNVAKNYLDYKIIKYDPDLNHIFVVSKKNIRYPLAYVDVKRIIRSLNEGITTEEADGVKREIANYIISAIEEKKKREHDKSKNKKSSE